MVVSEMGDLGSTSEADIGNIVRLGGFGVGFERGVVADERACDRSGTSDRVVLLRIRGVRDPD